MKLKELGPAIIVAAVVLGPGSILASSKCGYEFGFPALFVLACAGVLLFGMVLMCSRIGAVYEKTPGEELADRLGRIPSVIVGLAIFGIVALFQSSNNIAIVAGLEPIFGSKVFDNSIVKFGVLILANSIALIGLYGSRDLYRKVEQMMKVLVLVMLVAFVLNFLFVLFNPPEFEQAVAVEVEPNYLILVSLIATTFSVAGAYYQAYLAREKGWTDDRLKQGFTDSLIGVGVLCGMTGVILCTSTIMFHGRAGVALSSVGSLALQLEPVFGRASVVIFSIGILAGALSSFLINAIIGGTVFSDSLGRGSRLSDPWPKHFTAAALIVGLVGGGITMLSKEGSVYLITLAQALTVIAVPALALAILYLGTRPELKPDRSPPKWNVALVVIGVVVAFALAINTINAVSKKIVANQPSASVSITGHFKTLFQSF